MGPFEAQIFQAVFGISGAVAALGLILRFKLKKAELERSGATHDLGPAVDALRDEMNDTRAQLAEVHERLDFTERLLTEARGSQARTDRG